MSETERIYLESRTWDKAIVGIVPHNDGEVVVYHIFQLMQCLIEEGMSDEDALEWVSYNTIRALPHAGPRAPWMVDDCYPEFDCEDPEEPDVLVTLNGVTYRRVG